MSEWISVDDLKVLPEFHVYVLCCYVPDDKSASNSYSICEMVSYRTTEAGRYIEFEDEDENMHLTTHWMPLPSPPEPPTNTDTEGG